MTEPLNGMEKYKRKGCHWVSSSTLDLYICMKSIMHYDHLSQTLSVFRSNQFSESFKEQIMPRANIFALFQSRVQLIVSIILQIFYTTCWIFENLGNINQVWPSFSEGIFSHVVHLDQSHCNNILIDPVHRVIFTTIFSGV